MRYSLHKIVENMRGWYAEIMKMPDRIPASYLAPCGVDCFNCYARLRAKNSCSGCRSDSPQKPKHCLQCSRKSCAAGKGLTYCNECGRYPCASIKSLQKNYMQKYGVDLRGNFSVVENLGIDKFMAMEKARWTCNDCGGIISQHDNRCSECGKMFLEGGAAIPSL